MNENKEKELIVITAFCDTDEKLELLFNLIKTIKKEVNFDILVCSHTILPDYIIKNVKFYFYDSENTLLYDYETLPKQWYKLGNNHEIQIETIFNSFANTQLAIWRILISSFNIAKTFKYKKIHTIEYDAIIHDISEFYERSEYLNEYDFFIYLNDQNQMVGATQSLLTESLPTTLLKYDESILLEEIKNSIEKSPETLFNLKLIEGNKKIFTKQIFESKNNFNIISSIRKNNSKIEVFPFVNKLDNVQLFIKNNTDKTNNIIMIINEVKINNFNITDKNIWHIIPILNINDLNKLKVLMDDVIYFDFKSNDEILRLKKYSYEK